VEPEDRETGHLSTPLYGARVFSSHCVPPAVSVRGRSQRDQVLKATLKSVKSNLVTFGVPHNSAP
jgi:hypothetical protein